LVREYVSTLRALNCDGGVLMVACIASYDLADGRDVCVRAPLEPHTQKEAIH
jgi:hypothetical protein